MRLPKITVRFQTIQETLMMPRCIVSGSGAMVSALGCIGLGLVRQELTVSDTRQKVNVQYLLFNSSLRIPNIYIYI